MTNMDNESMLTLLKKTVPDRFVGYEAHYSIDEICAVAIYDPATHSTTIRWHSHAEPNAPIREFAIQHTIILS